jgi:ankyrin repeat protein
VQELLKHGAKVNTLNKEGFTLLYLSIENGHVGIFRELLNNGAKVDIANTDGWIPLHVAAKFGHMEIV